MNICSLESMNSTSMDLRLKNTLPIDIYAGDVDLLNSSYVYFKFIKSAKQNII